MNEWWSFLIIAICAVAGYVGVAAVLGKQDVLRKQPEDAAEAEESGRGNNAPEHWYEILSVSPSASVEAIQAAFRTEIAKYHPDRVASLGIEPAGAGRESLKENQQCLHARTANKRKARLPPPVIYAARSSRVAETESSYAPMNGCSRYSLGSLSGQAALSPEGAALSFARPRRSEFRPIGLGGMIQLDSFLGANNPIVDNCSALWWRPSYNRWSRQGQFPGIPHYAAAFNRRAMSSPTVRARSTGTALPSWRMVSPHEP